jgi:uncharacterized protein YcaQ
MLQLTWQHVNAGRLARQHLLERAPRQDALQPVRTIGGLQAQVMSSAELQLWARVDGLAADDVANALWRDRTLVKTWAMRGTLHLLAVDDFPLLVAALGSSRRFQQKSWLKYFGLTQETLDALVEGMRQMLTDQGMTREEVGEAIAKHTGRPELHELMLSSWGALLKPPAFQGYLCFGPNRGQNVTFVQTEAWLGKGKATPTLSGDEAKREIIRRYLAVYGPDTSDNFSRWFGLTATDAKRLFRTMGDELTAVEVEGWPAWALTTQVESPPPAELSNVVRLLPAFDPYTIALYRQPGILDPTHQAKVSRPQGWISPVVLVDGRMVGVWSHEKKRDRLIVTATLFSPTNATIQAGIAAEATRLADYLGGTAETVLDG